MDDPGGSPYVLKWGPRIQGVEQKKRDAALRQEVQLVERLVDLYNVANSTSALYRTEQKKAGLPCRGL